MLSEVIAELLLPRFNGFHTEQPSLQPNSLSSATILPSVELISPMYRSFVTAHRELKGRKLSCYGCP